MVDVKEIKKYECVHCGYTHDTEEDADDCCYISPKEIIVYKCGNCEKEYDTEEEAEECCQDELKE